MKQARLNLITEEEPSSPPAHLPPPRLGESLLATSALAPDQLAIALEEQKRSHELLGRTLLRLGFVGDDVLTTHLAQNAGLPTLPKNPRFDPKLVARLPRATAEKTRSLPYSFKSNILTLATADPFDIAALDEIRRSFPEARALKPLLASDSDIALLIDEMYGASDTLGTLIDALDTKPTIRAAPREAEPDAHAPPMIRFVHRLLADAVRQGASDIHLEPDAHQIRVRFRLDGALREVRSLHRARWPELSQRVKLLAGMNIADQRSIQDGRFDQTFAGHKVDFRVALIPTQHGENIVIRVLDARTSLLSLSHLGFAPSAINTLARLTSRPQGLTLVTGPTGSGKSTTLYALLAHLNAPDVNIATLEEPIEYEIDRVRQTAIAEDQGVTFSSGIRAILRQDPDIILIGEIRDADTAQMALRAAMTGHQVFATLHCNDVWGALPRLVDLGLNPEVLASHLCGIVAQRLVRQLCPACKIPCAADAEVCQTLNLDPQKPPSIFIPCGCPACSDTGRKGRKVLSEILDITPEIEDALIAHTPRKEIRRLAQKQGFESLQQDGARAVLNGTLAFSDLCRSVDMTRGLFS